jgi:hypothetical protein
MRAQKLHCIYLLPKTLQQCGFIFSLGHSDCLPG